jgi:hypothetical protein
VDHIDLAGMWGVVSCCENLCKRVCGPAALEDVGGPWGYTGLLEAIIGPTHERHSEFSEWVRQPFDPSSVNAEQLAQAVKKTPSNGRESQQSSGEDQMSHGLRREHTHQRHTPTSDASRTGHRNSYRRVASWRDDEGIREGAQSQ